MTWSTTSQPSFTISGGSFAGTTYSFTPANSTSTYLEYDPPAYGSTHGLVFKPNASDATKVDVYADESGDGDVPHYLSTSATTTHTSVVYGVTPGTSTIHMSNYTNPGHSAFYNYGSFTVPSFTSSGGSGGSGSGSGSGASYPPSRTTRFFSAAGMAISIGWSTYNIYSTASGSSPIGGPGGGGWIYDMVQNEEANEVSVTIEVGANLLPSFSLGSGPGLINQGSVTTVQPGDELYLQFDGHHDDVSETPNMTITSEVTDPTTSPPTTTNPSNTVNNTVIAGPDGDDVDLIIGSVNKPNGTITVFEKTPPGQADTVVASFQVKFNTRGSSNFW